MLSKALFFSSLPLWAKVASAAFGITTTDSSYTIDAGSPNPLKFTVSRSSCDITSINYYGSELQYQSKGSHIGSGLGSASVSAVQNGESSLHVSSILTDEYRRLYQGDLRHRHIDALFRRP